MRKRALLASLLLMVASDCWATTGYIYLVWQPMWAGEYGVVISAFTYESGAFNPLPAGALWATVDSNAVLDDGKPGNTNAAATYGLTLEVQKLEFDSIPDTLRVALHVPADDDTSKKEWIGWQDEVVPATARCILFNALSIIPKAPHFVDLRIVGSKKWAYLEGIHSLKNVKAPFHPMGLSNGKLQE